MAGTTITLPRIRALAVGALIAMLALAPLGAALILLHGDPTLRAAVAENGPVELLTFVAFVVAAAWGAAVVRRLLAAPRRRVAAAAMALFAIGCVLVAGEEVAWGQWFLGFETPEGLRELNSQGETTLHNIEGLQGRSEGFRLLFGLGGLAGVLLGRLRPLAPVRTPLVLLPAFLAVAVLAAGELATDMVTLPVEALHDGLRAKVSSEWQELAIGGLAVAYVAAVARRRHVPSPREAWALRA